MKKDLDRVGERSEALQMSFNADKNTVIHVGRAKLFANYSLLFSQIQTINLERYLEIDIRSDLK